jgi:hypothetical protein
VSNASPTCSHVTLSKSRARPTCQHGDIERTRLARHPLWVLRIGIAATWQPRFPSHIEQRTTHGNQRRFAPPWAWTAAPALVPWHHIDRATQVEHEKHHHGRSATSIPGSSRTASRRDGEASADREGPRGWALVLGVVHPGHPAVVPVDDRPEHPVVADYHALTEQVYGRRSETARPGPLNNEATSWMIGARASTVSRDPL